MVMKRYQQEDNSNEHKGHKVLGCDAGMSKELCVELRLDMHRRPLVFTNFGASAERAVSCLLG